MNGDATPYANKLSLGAGYILGAIAFAVCFVIAFQMGGDRRTLGFAERNRGNGRRVNDDGHRGRRGSW